jgi:hypothetical protein
MLYGVWVALTVGLPLGSGCAYWNHISLAVRILGVFLFALHVAGVPLWLRAQKRFLCSTQWAQTHDYQPERLRLFFD